MLLAFPGQELTPAEYESVLARAAGAAADSPPPGDRSGVVVVSAGFDDDAGADGATGEAVAPDGAAVADDPDAVTLDPDPVEGGDIVHVGGGWWELPDGSRHRGRDEAEQALALLLGE